MSAVRAVLGVTMLLFSFIAPAPVLAASDCGFKVDYAELVAVGTTHREALYLINVIPRNWTDRPIRFPSGFHLTAGTDAGSTTALDAEQVAPPPDNGWNSAMFLAVFPAPGIRWFTLDSVTADTKSIVCASGQEYVLPDALYSTDGTFDDAVLAPGPLPLVMPFQPPRWTSKVVPNYPDLAKEDNDQGAVTVAVTIDATGKTSDVNVVTSSGHRSLDDAALDAARASSFGPAIMPAALGGKAMALRFVIDYTFALDE